MRFPSRQRTDSTHARQSFSAGVQTMRARICSAFSCDMFARVVWLKLRRVRHCCFPLCPLPHALATHYFLRLTRARGRRFLRGWKILLNDFWYFWSCKSTIKEKLHYVSIRRQQALPYLGDAVQRWLRHPEPSSSSQKSTIKCKCNKHKHTLFRKK